MHKKENDPHPSIDITGTLSHDLSGKKIILALCGSVAVSKSSDLARLLMRHGAEVIPVMSRAATRLIRPELIHWATGNTPVTTLTGAVEHVRYAGNTSTKADLLLIAPATANTLGKIACGIDDTPVTTFATTALGEGIPVVIVPAMHEPMYRHPAVKENIERLRNWGVPVMTPRIEEGKAKIPTDEAILKEVLCRLTGHCKINPANAGHFLEGEHILITAGRTVEYLDSVRVISNNSSGKMGAAIAEEAVKAGARVTMIIGKVSCRLPEGIRILKGETSDEMAAAVIRELTETRYDKIIAAAAVGDWKPETRFEGKIPTHGQKSITVTLVPTEKILDRMRKLSPESQITAFRALPEPDENSRREDALRRLQRADADFIAVNDVSAPGCGFETDTNRLLILDKAGNVTDTGFVSKNAAAAALLRRLADNGK